MKKEKDLERLISDKDRTIREQQRVIRRLLSRGPGLAPGPASPTPDSSTSTLATITDTGDMRGDTGGGDYHGLMCFRVGGLFSRALCP